MVPKSRVELLAKGFSNPHSTTELPRHGGWCEIRTHGPLTGVSTLAVCRTRPDYANHPFVSNVDFRPIRTRLVSMQPTR
jgi:hypothetical protein